MKRMKNNPCYGCEPPKRTSDCHTYCPDWIIAKAFHEAERETEHEQSQINQYTVDMIRKNKDHSRKRHQSFRGHTWRNVQ